MTIGKCNYGHRLYCLEYSLRLVHVHNALSFSILAELLLVVHLVHATSDAVIVTPPPPPQRRLHSSTFQRSLRTVETIHNLPYISVYITPPTLAYIL